MAPMFLSLAVAALCCTSYASKTVTVTNTHTESTTNWKTTTTTRTVTDKCSPTTISTPYSTPSQPASTKKDWPGWAGISHMFVFGDSYITTGFNVSGTQPDHANPLGNPIYPGYTATNGPNWVDFLTTTYNRSFIETINLAYGGATVDAALEYLPIYASKPSSFPWTSKDTLFAVFFGINDVGNAWYRSNSSHIFAAEFKVYAAQMDTLYQTGARNFLFLNTPPVDRAPLTAAQGPASQVPEAAAIEAWNKNITALAANLTKTYKDATAFVFDTNAIFSEVLNDPASHPEIAPYKNTTRYCDAYMNGTPSWYTFDPNCTYPVDEYIWLNSLHPTFRMMDVTAQDIVKQLS